MYLGMLCNAGDREEAHRNSTTSSKKNLFILKLLPVSLVSDSIWYVEISMYEFVVIHVVCKKILLGTLCNAADREEAPRNSTTIRAVCLHYQPTGPEAMTSTSIQ